MQQEQQTFWSLNEQNGKLNPEILEIYSFLNNRGYRKRTLSGEIELYKQNSHFIEQTYTADQITEVINYLSVEFKETVRITIPHERKKPETFTYSPHDILEKLVKYGWGKIFSENNWNHLPELQVDIKKHTRTQAFFYFKNGYVEVTANDVKIHPYAEFKGKYIYKDFLVNRDIRIVDIDDDVERDFAPRGVNFFDFLSKAAGVDPNNPTHEQGEKLLYLMKLLGFLLHDYKQQGLTDFCVILCDDNTGGSGKGVIIQALRELTKVGIIDCRKEVGNYDPEEITERTRIKVYNDVQQSFNFGSVYNEITDGATVRHMYKSPRPISYADTWKTLLTSNFIIRGNSGPDKRRQKVFSMTPFFHDGLTLQDHYKHLFFSNDWNENDWNFFYNIMFRCVQLWLQSGYKINFVDREYNQRRLESHYPIEFREYFEGLSRGMYHETGDLFWGIKNKQEYANSKFVRNLNSSFFGRMLTDYMDDMKIKYHKNSNRTKIYIEKDENSGGQIQSQNSKIFPKES